jgi:tetratricopeptide (TPR) repeat protein
MKHRRGGCSHPFDVLLPVLRPVDAVAEEGRKQSSQQHEAGESCNHWGTTLRNRSYGSSPAGDCDKDKMPTRRTPTHVDSATGFAGRLIEARERSGLTQRQLSFPGCSTGYISRLEHGDRVPSLQVVHELARRLRVSARWLALGEGVARESGPEEMLGDAELALRLDDLDRARELYESLAVGELDVSVLARAEAGLGQLAFRNDDAEEAIGRLSRAYEIDPELDDPSAADTLGRAYARIGAEEEALRIFRGELSRAELRHDAVNRVRFAVLLANALIDTTEFSEATHVLSDALTDAGSAKDPMVLARIHWTQSRLHAHRGNTALARRYAQKALALLEATEHTVYTARAYRALSHIELDAGRPAEALGLIAQGRELLAGAGTEHDEAVFALEESRALAQLGRHDEAAALAMRSAAGFANAHPVDAGRSYAELAAALDRGGDAARALEVYELAIEFLERRPSAFLVEAYAHYAQVLEREGKLQEAFAAYKRAATLQTELAHT